jgi:hypothetical protein
VGRKDACVLVCVVHGSSLFSCCVCDGWGCVFLYGGELGGFAESLGEVPGEREGTIGEGTVGGGEEESVPWMLLWEGGISSRDCSEKPCAFL